MNQSHCKNVTGELNKKRVHTDDDWMVLKMHKLHTPLGKQKYQIEYFMRVVAEEKD